MTGPTEEPPETRTGTLRSRVSAALALEPGPAAVGTVVGLAGLLFLLEPVVGAIPVGGLWVRPVALSVVALAAGFSLGAAVFYRRGRRLFAVAHGVFGLAWTGLALGTLAGVEWLVVGAVLLVVAGSGFLAGRLR